MKKTQTEKLRNLYSRAWKRLQFIPGVRGLGIGERGWRIYVEAGLKADARRLPLAIAGFPAEIIPQHTTFLCYGNDFQKSLQPGVEIASKGFDPGSLGCFARLTADHKTIVLLSVSHVLYGDIASLGGSGDGNACGQASVCCCCCCKSHVIGNNRGNGNKAFNNVQVDVDDPNVPGTPKTFHGSEFDCGAAVLNASRPYTNQSQYYGMITGTPPAGTFGVSAGDPVEKVGSTTGHTTGKICEFKFKSAKYTSSGKPVPSILWPLPGQGTIVDESTAGSQATINQFMVIPDPDPTNASRKTYFAQGGDSGAVVVNNAKQVIGIVTRVKPLDDEVVAAMNPLLTSPLPPHAGNLGVVSPIGGILSALGVEIIDNMQGTVTTAGPTLTVPDDVLQHREKVLAMERRLQGLEREIREKALGRAVLERIKEHRPELTRLIEHRRAVNVAWHRCHGPAYAAHCLRSFEDQRYEVPSEADGVTPLELIQRMARVLTAHGSERLRHDVTHYELLALDLIAGCSSVWQLVDRIRELDSVVSADEVEVSAHSDARE